MNPRNTKTEPYTAAKRVLPIDINHVTIFKHALREWNSVAQAL